MSRGTTYYDWGVDTTGIPFADYGRSPTIILPPATRVLKSADGTIEKCEAHGPGGNAQDDLTVASIDFISSMRL